MRLPSCWYSFPTAHRAKVEKLGGTQAQHAPRTSSGRGSNDTSDVNNARRSTHGSTTETPRLLSRSYTADSSKAGRKSFANFAAPLQWSTTSAICEQRRSSSLGLRKVNFNCNRFFVEASSSRDTYSTIDLAGSSRALHCTVADYHSPLQQELAARETSRRREKSLERKEHNRKTAGCKVCAEVDCGRVGDKSIREHPPDYCCM